MPKYTFLLTVITVVLAGTLLNAQDKPLRFDGEVLKLVEIVTKSTESPRSSKISVTPSKQPKPAHEVWQQWEKLKAAEKSSQSAVNADTPIAELKRLAEEGHKDALDILRTRLLKTKVDENTLGTMLNALAKIGHTDALRILKEREEQKRLEDEKRKQKEDDVRRRKDAIKAQEDFLKLTVSRENIDKMLTDDQFKKDWDYLSSNRQENEKLKKECEKLTDGAEKEGFLDELARLSKGKTRDELLSELNGKNFAEVHSYKEKFVRDLAGKYAKIEGKINQAWDDQHPEIRLEREWQKKLVELKAKAAQAKPKAVDLRNELKKTGFQDEISPEEYIRYGTREFYDAWRRGDSIERSKLEPKLKFPPIEAKKKVFKADASTFGIGEPYESDSGWSVNVRYGTSTYSSRYVISGVKLTYEGIFGVGKETEIRTTLEQYPEPLIASLTRNSGGYNVVIVFDNLHIENSNVCADLISADIVEKGTERPVVNLYPETKIAGGKNK